MNVTDVRMKRITLIWSAVKETASAKGFSFKTLYTGRFLPGHYLDTSRFVWVSVKNKSLKKKESTQLLEIFRLSFNRWNWFMTNFQSSDPTCM